MQVSVETLKGLERKLTISVPTDKVEQEVSDRLNKLARSAKIHGFRPGKAPRSVVERQFSDRVRDEVARDMVQSTLFEALKAEHLNPAGYPDVELLEVEKGKDFSYAAVVEIFPEFDIKDIEGQDIEEIKAEVKDADVSAMLEKLREQNKTWADVKRAVAEGDKVVFDFEGFLGNEPFQGGKASDYELVIGSKSMIPGFEEGLVGKEIGKPFEMNITFPGDYHQSDLAGKETVFKIEIHAIQEGQLPELDDAFAAKFNLKEGGIDALKKDIQANMTRELEQRVSSMNREKIFNAMLEQNPIELPKAMIDREIENLKHDMYHRIFGNHHSDNEKIPDFPRELFVEQAERRVHLGLLFSEFVKKHEITADAARVDAMIEKFASAYETPDELKQWYNASVERRGEVEALVTEQMAAEKMAEKANKSSKTMSYDDVMNPKATEEKPKAKKKSVAKATKTDTEDKGE